ncbi:acyltransferase family protein [Rufibacter tibetensis]|uniref:Acyltransferase 3 domain-containing protein n=1 Tax=Rufibacter tibetensis TaxID=512763 RepID=A0A0P0C8F4_9BACT|nr:acyltransferase [Rufibacter tibetensis]ALI99765.1 hypothetical protein DC20_13265 [Rufibacter tibetensis]
MKKIFFPHLDGLRFIAFFFVFLFHSFYTTSLEIKNDSVFKVIYDVTREGYLGVNLFFVLSGFLITYLLIEEIRLKGTIDIKAFYYRRILRIWPLYFVCVAIGFFVFPWVKNRLGDNPYEETAQLSYYLFFLANYSNMLYGVSTPVLAVLWSVCIEEQFYLIWPVLVKYTPVTRMPLLLYSIIGLSTLVRIGTLHFGHGLTEDTFSVISDMAIGGLAAWLVLENKQFLCAIENLPKYIIVAIYLVLVWFIYNREIFSDLNMYWLAIDRLVLAVLFAFVILEQNFSRNSFYKLGDFKRISSLGKYTYGLYCLHFLALLVAYKISFKLGANNSVAGVVFFDNVLGLLIAFAMSYVSYHFFEMYFLKLKSRFSYISKD